MPHGTPDWGLVGPKATVYGLDDLGELAVRLGSPHLWDRRGDVVWLSDFRNGRGDIGDVGVPGSGEVRLYAGYARQGGFCVRLMPLLGNTVGLHKPLPYPVHARLGLEFSFSIEEHTAYVNGEIYANDGVDTRQGYIRYDVANDELQYRDHLFVPVWRPHATNLGLSAGEYCPLTLKVVIDLSTNEFVRAIVNSRTYPFVATPLRVTATPGLAYAWMRITHTADAVDAAEISVDNVIVTQNEP